MQRLFISVENWFLSLALRAAFISFPFFSSFLFSFLLTTTTNFQNSAYYAAPACSVDGIHDSLWYHNNRIAFISNYGAVLLLINIAERPAPAQLRNILRRLCLLPLLLLEGDDVIFLVNSFDSIVNLRMRNERKKQRTDYRVRAKRSIVPCFVFVEIKRNETRTHFVSVCVCPSFNAQCRVHEISYTKSTKRAGTPVDKFTIFVFDRILMCNLRSVSLLFRFSVLS